MKSRLLAGLLGVAFLGSVAFAQDVTPSIGAGSKAMLFTFSGLNALGANAYNGGLGAKFFVTAPIAIRASLQFMTANEKVPADPSGTDGSISGTTMGISAGGEYHLTMARVSPYVGAVLGFSTTSTKNETSIVPPATTNIVVKNDLAGENIGGIAFAAGNALGIAGLAGAEFFITKELSLSAEYQLGYTLISQYDQERTVANTTFKTKAGSISTIGISAVGALTLAIYF